MPSHRRLEQGNPCSSRTALTVPLTAPDYTPMPPEHPQASRALMERAILAFILPGVAGAINASGFFAVGAYTSHVTGAVARIGGELAAGHLWLAARFSIFVGCFFLGALVSTLAVLYGRR